MLVDRAEDVIRAPSIGQVAVLCYPGGCL